MKDDLLLFMFCDLIRTMVGMMVRTFSNHQPTLRARPEDHGPFMDGSLI